jgi:preprotein translocase subunit SecG
VEILKVVLVIIQFILALGLIAIVILQPSKGEGLGSIGGGSKLFFGKKKGYEAVLEKATTWVAVAFMVTSFLFIFTK